MLYEVITGEDIVPGCYEDLETTDLLVITGANTAWTHPVVFRRIQQARQRRPEMKMVVIDPRKTMTAEQADLHLAVRPGADVWLYNGLARYVITSYSIHYTKLYELPWYARKQGCCVGA